MLKEIAKKEGVVEVLLGGGGGDVTVSFLPPPSERAIGGLLLRWRRLNCQRLMRADCKYTPRSRYSRGVGGSGVTEAGGREKTFTEDYERLLTEDDLPPLPRPGGGPDLSGPSFSGCHLADGSEWRMRHT